MCADCSAQGRRGEWCKCREVGFPQLPSGKRGLQRGGPRPHTWGTLHLPSHRNKHNHAFILTAQARCSRACPAPALVAGGRGRLPRLGVQEPLPRDSSQPGRGGRARPRCARREKMQVQEHGPCAGDTTHA